MSPSSTAHSHDEEEDLARGATLKLAQRHHKIQASSITGPRTWNPQVPRPGVTGKVELVFTLPDARVSVGDQLTLNMPSLGNWTLPPAPNVSLELRDAPPAQLSFAAQWQPEVQCLTLTAIPAPNISSCAESESLSLEPGMTLCLWLSGITTPACATPACTDASLSLVERLVVRKSTVPVSTRGGQILAGPAPVTFSKIMPGSLSGKCTWTARHLEPGLAGHVCLEFRTHGAIPPHGQIRVELPQEGWVLPSSPTVELQGPEGRVLAAAWCAAQHTLEISLSSGGIPSHSNVSLFIRDVQNPTEECPVIRKGRLTTLVANGGVIDGPSALTISRISCLSSQDLELADQAFRKHQLADVEQQDVIALSSLETVLSECNIRLSSEAFERLVLTQVHPITPSDESAEAVEGGDTTTKTSNPEENLDENNLDHHSPPWIERQDFLACFTKVYRPSNKYGQELRDAASTGNHALVRELISRGCHSLSKDALGWTCVHYAASYGHQTLLETLAEIISDLEIDSPDKSGWTALMCAASNGHVGCVETLLNFGASIDLPNIQGRTALHWAAEKGHDSIVATLVLAGANGNAQDNSHWTPLHCAMVHQNVGAIKVLLEMGTDASCRDALGYDVLKYCPANKLATVEGLVAKSQSAKMVT